MPAAAHTDPTFRRALVLALVVCASLLAAMAPSTAHAAGLPNISLALGAPAEVPLGKPASVSLTASNPGTEPYGYNLSFRDLLPAGISYVAGSASFAGSPVEPQVIVANAGLATETTTLIWANVGDLSPNATGTLTYQVAHATTGINAYTVTGARSTYLHTAAAYINTNARTVPTFTAAGVQSGGSTGSDAKTATSRLTAVTITVSEPSPEGELLRGAHDHQTVYTLHLENNTVNPTGPLTVEAFLPAGLEFLRCGQTDNTTSAATNPGSTQEWPGSGPLSGNLAAPAPCDTPADVATVTVDPDGIGTLPSALYTRVRWTGLTTLTAGGARDIRFVAAVPLRANTATFAAAIPTSASLGQAANLDNNNGARTQDEQSLLTYATVAGNYNGVTPVSNFGQATVTAEDIRVVKSASQSTIADNQLTRWTLALATGEYRYVDNVRVSDVVPDGLCPLDTTNRESDATADCAPAGAGHNPSAPYQSATESAAGAWTLNWNSSVDAALTRMAPSDTHNIMFSTRSRPNYQQNGANDKPVLARDTWTNNASLLGADYQRCSNVPDCGALGVKLDPTPGLPAETDLDGTDDLDSSQDSQSAGGPAILKTIRVAGGVVPANCSGGTYVDGQAGPAGPYGPGDRVCFKLRVDFPALLDTGSPTVTDFLPAGVTFEGPYVVTANNTVTIASSTGVTGDPVVTWTLGSGAGSAVNGQVFEVLVAGRVTDPTLGASADIKGNLLKVSHANSVGQSFPLRDQVDFTWAEPQLTLLEGIRDINGTPVGGLAPNTDDDPLVTTDGISPVQAGDAVTVRVDVTNSGTRDAINATVWERLPSGTPSVGCPAGINISDGGTCSAGVITWSGVSVPAGTTKTLTYRYTVPAGARPGTTFSHHAGVRTYQAQNNVGGTFSFFPGNNIDPTVTAPTVNAANADDTTNVATAGPVITYTATSDDIDQIGNATGAARATIGERISYTATATIPQGTTLQDTAGPATFSIPYGTGKQSYVAGTAIFRLNGAALPAGFTSVADANGASVTFPANYVNAAGSAADVVTITYATTVDNVAANKRTAGQSITTTATLRFANGAGVAQTPNAAHTHTIVEPNLTLAKASNAVGGRVSPGQTVRYTLTVTNPSATRISGANDVIVVDTVPAGLTPVGPTGIPIANGANVQPSPGVWNSAARTIRYTQALAAVDSSTAYSYDVKVSDPEIGNASKTNNAVATATSYPAGAPGTERDATSATAQSALGYSAAAAVTVKLTGASLTKTVDVATATVGEQRTYTLDATIPGELDLYDVTVLDLLPDGMDYEPGSFSATCVGGCGLTATAIAPTANADGSTQLGFFIGDVTFVAADRVVHITYRAHVDDRYEPEATQVARGNALSNTAVVHTNQTNVIVGTPLSVPPTTSFSDASATVPAAVTVTVTEPTLTIDKDVSGQVADLDVRTAQPGNAFTYTLTLSNATGNAIAHDVVVTDLPDAELVNVSSGALPAGVTLPDGWSAADPDMRWNIASIAAGATVTLTYTADLTSSASLREADQAINTADIVAYFGRPSAERTANGFDYRAYGTGAYGVTEDVVTVSVDLPRIEVDLTTGAAGFPESAAAEVGQPFGWRATVRNTSPSADARNVDLTVRLPANWTYTAGSQSGGGGEPTITPDAVNGDLLTWSNFVNLAPGANRVVTFDARPTLAAKTNPGTGAANIARSNVTADDITGAAGSGDGPYADGPDPAQGVLLAPALAVVKTPDNGSVTAGTTGAWTIRIDNNGTGTARNVRVTDTIPAGVTYAAGAATSANPGFSESANVLNGDGTRTVTWTLSDLAPSATATISVPVAVPATDDAGTTYTNSATVRADEQPAGPTDTGSLDVLTRADLAVAKTVAPTTQDAGDTVEFTMLVTNNGPSEARAATLTDTLPPGLTFASFSQGGADCTESAGAISCAFATLAPGATRTVKVLAVIDADRTAALTNSATVATSTTDPSPANNTDDAVVSVSERADLEVTKTADSSPVLQGENATFSVLVENHGPSDARNVSVSDALPAGLTLVSMSAPGATCDLPSATCALGTIAAGAQRTVTVVARATTPGVKTNVASATTSAADPAPGNDSDDASVTVDPAVDLSMLKTGPAAVTAGSDFDYTLTASNSGPSGATGVTVTDTLAAGLSFVSADADQGTCDYDAPTRTLTCALGALADGDSTEIAVRVTASFSLADGSVVNSATVTGDQQDPDAADNASSAQVDIGPASDLELTKSVSADPVTQTKQLTYTLTVTNLGGSDDTGVTITDTLPAGISYVSDDGGCAESAQTVTCAVGDLADGASATIQIVATADSTGVHTNTASVMGANPDEEPGNNADSTPVSVDPAVDLALEKTGAATVTAGDTLAYALTATNNGPSDATGVTIVDTLPDGLAYVSDDAGCDETAGTVTCTVGDLASGADVTITVTVRAAHANAEQTLTNSATAGAAETELDTSDNSDSADVTVGPSADLAVSKTVDPGTVAQNRNATYALTIANHGVSDATSVTLADALPAGMTFVSLNQDSGPAASCSTPAVGATGTVTCTWATLATAAVASFSLTGRAITTGALSNTATVSADEPDPDPTDNAASADLLVGPTADMAITKTGPATAAAGGGATYTLTATNNGPSDAHNVRVTDTLPAGLTFVSATPAQGTCSESAGVIGCDLGDIAAGASTTVQIVTAVAFGAAEQTLTNTATVRADEADNDAGDDTASAQTSIGPAADLRIGKTVAPANLAQNRQATYTLTVTNDGPSDATGVTVSDPLPAGVAFISASAGCTEASGTVTCTLGDLAADDSTTVTITVRAVENGTHVNTATVTGNEPDADIADNTADVSLSVGPTSDLSVAKTGPATVAAGANATYVITARNAGPSAATGVTVTDTLPPGMRYVSSAPSQGGCAEDAGVVTCQLGDLARDSSATVELTALASFEVAGESTINNVVIAGEQNDNDPSDDTASHPVTVGPAADLALVKTSPASVPAGGRLLYTLAVTNAGPQDATGVTVSDVLPDGLTFASAQPSQGSCSADGQAVTCALGDIGSGGGAQVLLAADVAAGQAGRTLRNVATVTGARPDPDPGNDADDAGTGVTAARVAGGISVTKVANADGPVRLGVPVSFTITVTNDSAQTATGVVGIDTPSGPVKINSVTPSQGHCTGLRCELGALAPGAHATIEVVMTPKQTGPLNNSVTVSGDQGDNDETDNSDAADIQVRSARTRLRVGKRAARRIVTAGETVRYTITARNAGKRAATNVRVCDTPGAHVTFVTARGSRFHRGRACWRVAFWKAGRTRQFHVRARIDTAAGVRAVNRASAQARNAKRVKTRAIVNVMPFQAVRGGGVTG